MAGHYLLTLEESSNGHDFITRHLVKAEDRQKVKYHYHRTLKDWGFGSATWGDKHALSRDGLSSEIHKIQELTSAEARFLDEFLYNWTKV
jgi:hypothetical protein